MYFTYITCLFLDKLTVKENVTKLIADQVWGALRGLETFSQLLFRRRETDLVQYFHHKFHRIFITTCLRCKTAPRSSLTSKPQYFQTLKLSNTILDQC